MSERNMFHSPDVVENGVVKNDEGGLRAPPGLGLFGKAWWWFHFLILLKLARLRFIAILIAVGGLIAYWDTLRANYDKWTRPLFGQETAVSPDTEYWCPMHPSIVRDHPDKCPICSMPLSRRKKGEATEDEALPPGVVSRVQLTPYKVAVAGIETTEIGYQPLTKDISATGFVEFDERKLARIAARPKGKSRIDKLDINFTGQMVRKGQLLATLYSPVLISTVQNLLDARQSGNGSLERMARERLELWGIDKEDIQRIVDRGEVTTHVRIRSPINGHVIKKYVFEGEYVEEGAMLFDVADLSTVWIQGQVYEDDIAFLKEGLAVTATTRAYPNRPFSGKVAFVHPHLDATTRTLMVRFDMDNPQHDLRPGMWATVKFQVPVTELDLLSADANEQQRENWKQGRVLALPERAVIDTGSHKFVYREGEMDVFEGVEVELGPRSGGFYPVLRGLQAGDRVATTGSFLIDAETRLTAGVNSTYFGASGGPHSEHGSATTAAARPSMTRDDDTRFQVMLSKLNPADRPLVESQGYCPVLRTRLGSMGLPVSVTIQGQKVFLCCKMCVKKAKADEKATLGKVAELKSQPRSSPGLSPVPLSGKEAKIRANLAKLSAEDRRLAEEQKVCPIEPENRLGQMGVPVIVEIKGRKVFLCCKGCQDDALRNPEQTLAQVEKLKAEHGSKK
jgi:Cu(I)/Ag(I) efflux system membrane fusion protein